MLFSPGVDMKRFACSTYAGTKRAVAIPAVQSRRADSNVASPPKSDAIAPDATHVRRQPGITDGEWNKADQNLVKTALHDSKKIKRPKKEERIVLLGKTEEELRPLVERFNHPKYRAKQIHDALMQGAAAVNKIRLIPQSLRDAMIEAGVTTGRSVPYHRVKSTDGTRKFLRQLHDGRVVETVGIPEFGIEKPRLTVCVSSQVGCPMRCTFCATGKGGFARNLEVHEIVDQVLAVQEDFDRRVSNVVFMGMGEPLLNRENVVAAIEVINKQIGIGARHITISTVGVPDQIRKLAMHKLQCVLAVSLHAPSQELREKLVPSAKAYPIHRLLSDCTNYFRVTSRRVSFEYTVIDGVNDSPFQAQALAQILRQHYLVTHVNLIPWNPVDDSDFKRPRMAAVRRFGDVLVQEGFEVSERATRGTDANAACGQLRNSFQKKALDDFAALK